MATNQRTRPGQRVRVITTRDPLLRVGDTGTVDEVETLAGLDVVVVRWDRDTVRVSDPALVAQYGDEWTVERVYATDRAESDPCECGTVGCSIDHGRDDGGCATW